MADNNQNREGGHKIKDATQAKPPFCDCVHEADCPLGKIGRLFEICRGTASGLTPEQCKEYRDYWQDIGQDTGRSPENPQQNSPADQPPPVFEWPCRHRGKALGLMDCGCSDPSTVYECNSPRSEVRTCIIRKTVSGRIVHNRCNDCPVREEPT